MRHLSTSLPPASGRRRNEQPQDLLSDFRAAALSVTNLYKTAAVAQTQSRAAGYQDALDDLLGFLDKENLGLMDGEGWRVRRWATERLDQSRTQRQAGSSDDDEEAAKDDEVRAPDTRSSSPETQKRPTALPTASSEMIESSSSPNRRVPSEPPLQHPPQQHHTAPTTIAVPTLSDFTFRSNQTYPTNHDREAGTNMELDASNSTVPSTAETVRILPRAARNRYNRQRGENRSINFNLGTGAGNKRKIPYPEFFDISGINFDGQDRKDGAGRGGKRGRHV